MEAMIENRIATPTEGDKILVLQARPGGIAVERGPFTVVSRQRVSLGADEYYMDGSRYNVSYLWPNKPKGGSTRAPISMAGAATAFICCREADKDAATVALGAFMLEELAATQAEIEALLKRVRRGVKLYKVFGGAA